jgi:hypothetical protein
MDELEEEQVLPTEEAAPQEEDPSVFLDVAQAPFRGVEGALHGAYNLADMVAFDVLPDWDTRFLGTSKTTAGSLVEGISQFATGFIPIFGAAGKIGSLAKAGKIARGVAAGAVTDFTVFKGQEDRLSNLVQQFPELQNPVTEFLAHDADETEVEGRLKNVLEGLILEGAIGGTVSLIGGTVSLFMNSLRALKAGKKVRDIDGLGPDDVNKATSDSLEGGRLFVDDEGRLASARESAEFDEAFREVGGDPEDIPEIDLSTVNWDEVDLEDVAEVAPRLSREELETLEAGGKLISEQTTDTGIVKTYEMPSGSKRTVMVDVNDPERVIAADLAFAPKMAADLDATYGKISSGLKKDFYDKTLVEEVSNRMQTGKPMTAREAIQDLADRTNGNLGEYSPVVKRLLALGKETGIDARIEERSFASNLPEEISKIRGSFYDSEGRRIVLDAQDSSVKNNPVYNLLHESTHAVTVDNVSKHYDRDAFGNIELEDVAGRSAFIDNVLKQKDLPKPIAEMFRMFKKADGMRDEIASKGKLVNTKGESDLYWVKNPMEFMSMAFSDPQLQRALKGIQYTPKMTMWEKVVNIVKSFFGKGVSTDLADNIVSRVGDIAEMKLPGRKGKGVEGMPTAFHGTPHVFKPKPDAPFGEFMKSKIGTGEGAQAFGHGFYVAEAKGVARHYYIGQTFRHLADDLERASGGLNFFIKDGELTEIYDIIDEIIESGGATSFIKESAKRGEAYASIDRANFKLDERKIEFLKAVRGDDYLGFDNPIEGILHAIKDAQGKGPGNYDLSPATRKAAKNLGRIYEIDVSPDIDKFMSWDKPMLTQPKKVQKTLKAVVEAVSDFDPDFPKDLLDNIYFDVATGRNLYETLAKSKSIGGPEAASDFLYEMGIPGIKYLQGGSARLKGVGSHNYVVFNEKDLKITSKVDFAPTGGKARGVPSFDPKLKTDPEWQQWTDAVLKGESPTLPRLEVVGDIDSAHKILTEKYNQNPKLLDKFDKGEADFLDDDLNQLFKLGAQSIKDRRRIRVESEIFKDLLRGSNEKLMQAVKAFDDTESLQSEAALRNQLSEFVEIYDYYRQMGSEDSKNLAMRRQKKPISRKIGLERSELENTALVKEFLNNESGGMSPKKASDLIKEMYDPNNAEESIKKILGLSKKVQGKHLLDVPSEYWINSLLSGPRTQAVNFLGNALTQALGTLEMTTGAILTGNLPLAKAAIASWADYVLWKEAFSAAGKTLVTGKEVLDVGSRTLESSRQAIGDVVDLRQGLDESKSFKQKTIDTLGGVVNLPARGLLTGDELFKQLAFRRATRLKAGMEAINLGMKDPKEISGYIADKLNKVVATNGQVMSQEALIREAAKQADDLGLVGVQFAKQRSDHIKNYVDQNFDEDASVLASYALDEAKYFTHTRELEEGTLGKGLQNLSKSWPLLRFVMPFVRTPTNLLSFAFERSPLSMSVKVPGTDKILNVPGLRSEAMAMREGIFSTDPVIKAATIGKAVTSFSVAGMLLDLVLNNNEVLPVITGGGPTDERQRKILEETGWRPYSMLYDGKYYSYQRLDPIATLLGTTADLSEMLKEDKEANEYTIETTIVTMATAISRNLSNKSYLAGIQLWSDAFQEPERFGERVLKNYAGSSIPNIFSQAQDYDKQSLREVRDVADAILKKTPGGRAMLDPKRNILGEEKIIDYGTFGFINPIASSEDKADPILLEMAELQHGFRMPSSKMLGGNVDLLEYANEEGQSAYDRRLELLKDVTIGGRTLRQALNKLIKSSSYKKLMGFDAELGIRSPRVDQITKVLNKYKNIAQREMLKEFPELASKIRNTNLAREDVLALLSQ